MIKNVKFVKFISVIAISYGFWQYILNYHSLLFTFQNFNELLKTHGLIFQIINIILSGIIPGLFIMGGFYLFIEKIQGKIILRWALLGALTFTVCSIGIFWYNYFTLPEMPQNGIDDGAVSVNTMSDQYIYYIKVLAFGVVLYILKRTGQRTAENGTDQKD